MFDLRLSTRDARIEEWLDASTLDDTALRLNLRDIRRINALLGWTPFTARAVVAQARRLHQTQVSVLDVCSGSADIPLAIARLAHRRALDMSITATDLSPQIVQIAAEQAAATSTVQVERQDALQLPYPDRAFDIALCTLALHHFAPESAVALLQSMARVARQVMVFDVVRHPLAYIGAWLLTHVIPMDAMTRHDAPVSVRRAYSASEVRALAARAGLPSAQVQVEFPFRLALMGAAQRTEE